MELENASPSSELAEPLVDVVKAPSRDNPLWPLPLVISAAMGGYLLASAMAFVIAIFVVHGKFDYAAAHKPEYLQALMRSPVGLIIIVLVPQLVMASVVVVAATFSPLGILKRLRLVRGQWPLALWITAALATPLIGMISSIVVGLFMEESATLQEMSKLFRLVAKEGYLIPLAFLIGITPGICEELVFRGYVQSRLTMRVGAVWGIFIASLNFAIFHLDLVHATAVFALGIWLGWVCWQSGSLFPAMLAHFFNNALSVMLVTLAPETEAGPIPPLMIAVVGGVIVLGFGSFVATVASAYYLRTLAPLETITTSAVAPSPPLAIEGSGVE